MYPGTHAAREPDKIAGMLLDTGETLTYGQLESHSVRLAHVLHDAGLRPGDVVAMIMDNDLHAFEVYWAALRSGLYVTAINHHLSADECGYIVTDSGARAVVVSAAKRELAEMVSAQTTDIVCALAFGGPVDGYASYEEALAAASDVPFADQPHGMPMLYSSGTTGRPKGVRPTLPRGSIEDAGDPMVGLLGAAFGLDRHTVYLSPAPIYHAAPMRWCAAVQAHGGTAVVLKKFDAETCLRAIDDFEVTHAQFVPTMFVRMLRLPAELRKRYRLCSLRLAVHSAAPCPVEVKQQMIDWWGPILVEYYGATEGTCMTITDSLTWLTKPGTVGKAAIGILHICDDAGAELAPGEIGNVYVERDSVVFTYHNDPVKTRAAQHPEHETWTTLGDVGYLDDDGFLFLTDRKAFMIISGGVNIYPQETENVLALHPAVYDVAVIGVPDPDMGESVVAFIQPAAGVEPSPELEREIVDFVKSRIASFKAPRHIRFVQSLPRTETGKLAKASLKQVLISDEPLNGEGVSARRRRAVRWCAPG